MFAYWKFPLRNDNPSKTSPGQAMAMVAGLSVLGKHRDLWTARLTLLVLLTTVSGCTTISDWVHNGFKVGPEYFQPAAPIADDWIDSYDARIKQELTNDSAWWKVFNDPAMTGLIETSYEQNLPLQAAGMRVLQARSQQAIAIGGLFPQGQEVFGEYARNQLSKNTFPGNLPGFPRAANFWSTGFDAFWEIDFWGQFRRNIEAADADLDASIEAYDNVLVILLADTAATYVEYRTLQQQLAFAKNNVTTQQKTLDIADAQFKGGAVSQLDPLQAEADLKNTEQFIPTLEAQLRNANLRLCLLLGIPPHDLSAELGEAPIPTAPVEVAIGIPADLLRRRPDVRAAEREVAAQSARIGVATADLFPHFSISGNIRVESAQFSTLFTGASTAGSIGPAFDWDILNYGRLVNNIRLQDAVFQELATTYMQTVLQANAEVESALVNYLKAQEKRQDIREQVDASQQAVQIAVSQYETGAINFNRVSNLQLALVGAQNSLAEAEGEVVRSLIAVYKALGGGWQIRLANEPQVPAEAVRLPRVVGADELLGA